jgi:glycosyltransferase involved in cell wall biosynthesis
MEKGIAEGLPLHLVVAGVGPAMDDIKARLGDHASVPGFIAPPELARLYASVDILAMASEVETHSMVVVEAIASGCPVLVARKSGVGGLFNDTTALRIVDDGVEGWAAALKRFASRSDERSAMREAALRYNHEHLTSWQDVLVEDFLSIWQQASGRMTPKHDAA